MHLPALLQFLAELHENNNKPWFLHNKPHYDILRAEFIDLVAAVGAKVQKFDHDVGPFEPKKAVFRIYRDVRFSKEKSPFKDHIGAVIGARTTDKSRPIYYFQINHKGVLMVACGLYMPDAAVIKKLRDSLVTQPKPFQAMLRNKTFVETFGALSDEDRMQRPPKGYPPDLPLIEHIKNRHFICVTEISLKKKPPKDLADWIATKFEAAHPLVKWIRTASAD